MPKPMKSAPKMSVLNRSGVPARKTRILVVDDDPDIRQFLSIALTALNFYEIEEASCASEAFLAMDNQTCPFDCLLLDIQMPMMTGVTLCEAIRKIPEYRDVPIIMLTAMADRKYLDDAFAVGATDYMTKPFDLVELRTRIGDARKLTLRQKTRQRDTLAQDPETFKVTRDVSFDLDQAIPLPGIDRFVCVDSFENYVVQSTRQGLENSFVCSVKITNCQKLHTALSGSDFKSVLQGVGAVIARQSGKSGGILSYRGNGVFLIMGFGNSTLSAQALREGLGKSHRLAGIAKAAGLFADVLVGEPVQLNQQTEASVLFALNQAITDVQDKDTQSGSWMTYSEWRSEKKTSGKEQDHIEQRAYERLLQGILQEQDRTT